MDARLAWAKMTWSKGLLFLFALNLVWVVSLFVAPLTIAPGTFAFTKGSANIVDHWDLYAQPAFNWYAKVIYVLGDAQCHQLWYRSLWINGNQMPMDARMTSLYAFAALGLLWAMTATPSISTSRGIANAFPARIRRWAERVGPEKFSVLVVFLGILPVAVDGFTQLLSGGAYESTNVLRVLTGVPGGLVMGLVVGVLVKSVKQFNIEYKAARDASQPRAPDKV